MALQAASSVPQINFMSMGFEAASASSQMSPFSSLTPAPQKPFSSATLPAPSSMANIGMGGASMTPVADKISLASFGDANHLAALFSCMLQCLAIMRRLCICMPVSRHVPILYHHQRLTLRPCSWSGHEHI